jgi:hypothetical protein
LSDNVFIFIVLEAAFAIEFSNSKKSWQPKYGYGISGIEVFYAVEKKI